MNNNFDIKVNPQQSRIVQETLFELGYSWGAGQRECINVNWKMLSIHVSGKIIQGSITGTHTYNSLLSFDDFIKYYANNTVVKYYSTEQMIKFAKYYVEHINDDMSAEDLLKIFVKCI